MSELKCQVLTGLKYRKVVRQGNICDVSYRNFRPRCYIKKITKNLYQKIKYKREKYEKIVVFNGQEYIYEHYKEDVKYYSEEIFEMAPRNDDKIGMRNIRSLRHIFRELGYLINTNFQQKDSQRQQFITLTYAENMQDDKQLYNDFKNFIKRLMRAYKQHEFAWIGVVEPQGRGAWHVHLLIKTLNCEKLELANWDIQPIWGHGITHTERLNSTDNVGAYFRAYLTNAELSDAQISELGLSDDDVREIPTADGTGVKKIVKGERLKHYPAYMKIYRHSRNITYPDKKFINQEEVEKQYPEVTYQSYREIEVDEGKILKILTEQRRKEKSERTKNLRKSLREKEAET